LENPNKVSSDDAATHVKEVSMPEHPRDNLSASLVVSICIPTYNREALLRRCLDRLLPQIPNKPVEVVVIDNASTDGTEALVRSYLQGNPGLRYIRHPENLGYLGSQEKCILEGRGKYTAILCDDDVYGPQAIDTMLPVLSGGDYSFVALNYYSFIENPDRIRLIAAPEESFKRDDAYEVYDFPSVGHYSGYVLNTRLAQAALPGIWDLFSREQYERSRGILAAVAICTIKASSLPGYFIGDAIVGAGAPETVDYDRLNHICIDNYTGLHTLKERGLLTQKDIARREDEIIRMLPKALLRDGGFLSGAELARTRQLLFSWFEGDPRFHRAAVMLGWMRFGAVRALFRLVVYLYMRMRWLRRRAVTA
jgi:glycosyltransferase involved in cell wall biosynthesis